VLAVDYRGFGKSDASGPPESQAVEDAQAAWGWLAAKYPKQPRYKVARIGSPLLVVHGAHQHTNAVGQARHRVALAQLFQLK
jgi:pimeloyl-ACP methyl ester carboxylesterase